MTSIINWYIKFNQRIEGPLFNQQSISRPPVTKQHQQSRRPKAFRSQRLYNHCGHLIRLFSMTVVLD